MGILDNSDFARKFLNNQSSTGQNNMIPNGQAWTSYLDYSNPLSYAALQNLGLGNTMMWGQNGIPGLTDLLSQYQQNLPAMFSKMTGNNDNSQGINQALLDSIFGQNSNVNSAYTMMNNGNPQMQDIYNIAMGQFNNPYNQGQGDVGNSLIGGLGHNPVNESMSNIGATLMGQGGYTGQLNGGMDNVMSQLVNNGGVTPSAGAGMGMGQDLMKTGLANSQAGQNWTNPQLQQGSNAAQNIIANGGGTPGINSMQQFNAQNLAGGDYGQTQSGFDFANTLMNGGGLSKYTTGGGDLALQYAQGGGPSLTSNIPFSLPNISGISALNGFSPGSDVSAGPVDSGYTSGINDIEAKAKKILDSNPLMDFNSAVSMARNNAATSVQQQQEAAMGKALARGGGPGSTVANGLQNRGMAEYADAGAQAESKAMFDQANTQQGLQLQKYGIGADLAKAMEQVAQGRNASSSQLAGQVASANAGVHAANAGASANVASANASLQAQLAKAQMDLYGNLAGLNAQRQMTGLNDLVSFGGQANNQMTAGLNAIPALQNAANNRYQTDMDSYMKGEGLKSQNLATGFSGLGNLQGIQTQGQTARMDSGNQQTNTGANLFNQGSATANSNLNSGLNMIPGYQNAATGLFNAGTNAAQSGQNQQMDWTKIGSGLSQNNLNNTDTYIKDLLSAATGNANFQLGAGQVANSAQGNTNSALSSAFANSLGMSNLDLSKFTALNGANNSSFNGMSGNNSLLAQIIAQSQNSMGGLSSDMMKYLMGTQAGFYGINPASGAGGGLSGLLSSTIGAAGQAAAAYAKGGG